MPDWTIWEVLSTHKCQHPLIKPTQATKSNGVVCVYLQCANCGAKIKETRKGDYSVAALPLFDLQLQEKEHERITAIRENLQEQWNNERDSEWKSEQAQKDKGWRDKYNIYLRTPHWQQVRRRALVRDGFLCQNCFCKVTESSAHGHHISYEAYNRLGFSFAFEVVSLCRSCHDSFHGK